MSTGSDEQRPAPPTCSICGERIKYHAPMTGFWAHGADTPIPDDGHQPPVPESLPVGTDSARAEAERRWTLEHFDPQQPDLVAWARNGFVAGAEWARAEERKARGE